MASSSSPCAACKFLRRKCTQECVFAPYFPPDQPQKFASVHKVFGASNVAKLLNELSPTQREDAVNSLAYEADERLKDPVYGCVGLISLLQQKLKQLQVDLYAAKRELSQYIGPNAMLPMMPSPYAIPQQQMGNPSTSNIVQQHNMLSMMGLPAGGGGQELLMRDHPRHQHQQQQYIEAQQLVAAQAVRDHHYDIYRTYDQQQQLLILHQQQQPQHQQLQEQQQQLQRQQQELMRFNSGFDASGSVTATGYNQLTAAASVLPSLALGTYDNAYHIQPQAEHHQHQLEAQLLLQPQTQEAQQQHQESETEDGKHIGPSC